MAKMTQYIVKNIKSIPLVPKDMKLGTNCESG